MGALVFFILVGLAPVSSSSPALQRSLVSNPEIYFIPEEIEAAFQSKVLSLRLHEFLNQWALPYFQKSPEGLETVKAWVNTWPIELQRRYEVRWESVLNAGQTLSLAEKVVLIYGFTLTFMDGLRVSPSDEDREWVVAWEKSFERDFETLTKFLTVNPEFSDLVTEWAQAELQRYRREGGALWASVRAEFPGPYGERELKGSEATFQDLDLWVRARGEARWEPRHRAALWLLQKLVVTRPEIPFASWSERDLSEIEQVLTAVRVDWSPETIELTYSSSREARLKAEREAYRQEVFEDSIPYFAGSALSFLSFLFLIDYPKIQLQFSRTYESLENQRQQNPEGSPAHRTAVDLQRRLARTRAEIERFAASHFGNEGWERLKPYLDQIDEQGTKRVTELKAQCAFALREIQERRMSERSAYRRFRKALLEVDPKTLANDRAWHRELAKVYSDMREALRPLGRGRWKYFHLRRLQRQVERMNNLPLAPYRGSFFSRLSQRAAYQWEKIRSPWRRRLSEARYEATLPGEGVRGYFMGLNARSARWLAPLFGTSLFLRGWVPNHRAQNQDFVDGLFPEVDAEVSPSLRELQIVNLSDALRKALDEVSPDGGPSLNERRRLRQQPKLEFALHSTGITEFNRETGRAEKVYVILKPADPLNADVSTRLQLAREGILLRWKRVDSEENHDDLQKRVGFDGFLSRSAFWVFDAATILNPTNLDPREAQEQMSRVERAVGLRSFFSDNPRPAIQVNPSAASLLLDQSQLPWAAR